MKRIRTLAVIFQNEIQKHEVEAFRGAVIHKSGIEHSLFHNHTAQGRVIYRYPLIQYKCIRSKPMLYCIDQGVDEVHHFFSNKNWSIEISGRILELKVDRLDLKSYTLQVWNRMFNYTIWRWLALNKANYEKYLRLTEEQQRREMLAGILVGNMLSFAKAVQWNIDQRIVVVVKEILSARMVLFKQTRLLAIDVAFATNVGLPRWISLGKGASHGFGMISLTKV